MNDNDLMTILAGAVPVITGAMAGGNRGMAAGASIGGQALLDEYSRRAKLNDSLLLANRKKQQDGDDVGTLKKIWSEDAQKNIWAKAADAVGSEAPRSFAIKEDPLSGKQTVITKETAKARAVDTPVEAGISKDFGYVPNKMREKKIEKFQPKFNTIKQEVAREINELDTALEGINKGGKLGDKLGVMRLVKQIETRLSDKDRDFYTLPIGWLQATWEKLKRNKDPGLNKELIEEAKTIIVNTRKHLGSHVSSLRKDYSKQLERSGVPFDYSYNKVFTMPNTGTVDLGKTELKPIADEGHVLMTDGKKQYNVPANLVEKAIRENNLKRVE